MTSKPTHLTIAGDAAYRDGYTHGSRGLPIGGLTSPHGLREAYMHGYEAGRKLFEARRQEAQSLWELRQMKGA
jgi:hypothetical protein